MLKESMQDAKEHIRKKILENVNLSGLDDDQLEQSIRLETDRYYEGQYISISDKANLTDEIFSSIRGFGLLDGILNDDTITEVMINGAKEIFIEKSGKLTRMP